MTERKLVLYKKDSCPFCQKVMRFMDKNKITSVELKDIIEDPKNKEYLIEHGGKNMVPCLFIDGKPMYESDDIIQYLKDTLLQGKEIEEETGGSGTCPLF